MSSAKSERAALEQPCCLRAIKVEIESVVYEKMHLSETKSDSRIQSGLILSVLF